MNEVDALVLGLKPRAVPPKGFPFWSLKMQKAWLRQNQLEHGKNCTKKKHGPQGGYLHDEKDDRPYDVDGCTYCGRCHQAL